MVQIFFGVVNVQRNTRTTVLTLQLFQFPTLLFACICMLSTADLRISIRLFFSLLLEKMFIFIVWLRLIENIMEANVIQYRSICITFKT
jgi:hypothetical protein